MIILKQKAEKKNSKNFILQEYIPIWSASFTNLKPTAVKITTQFAFKTNNANGFQEMYLIISLHCTLLANHQKDLKQQQKTL